MSWPAVHINYGNHARYEGIEDIVDILLQAFRGQRIRVSHGAEFDFDSVNIIIDEFTDPRFNIELQRMKERHPKLQLVLVHTEFIRKDFFFNSYNLFNTQSEILTIQTAIIAVALKYRDYSTLRLAITPCWFFRCFLFLPKVLWDLAMGKRRDLLAVARKGVYNFRRWQGINKVYGYFDDIICLHPAQIGDFADKGLAGKLILPPITRRQFREATSNIVRSNEGQKTIRCSGFATSHRKKFWPT